MHAPVENTLFDTDIDSVELCVELLLKNLIRICWSTATTEFRSFSDFLLIEINQRTTELLPWGKQFMNIPKNRQLFYIRINFGEFGPHSSSLYYFEFELPVLFGRFLLYQTRLGWNLLMLNTNRLVSLSCLFCTDFYKPDNCVKL